MPAMTALEFADTIVVPTVEEFMRDPTQRRGYLACLAVYHLGDYLKETTEKFATDVHKAFEDDLGLPFLALQRMADAVKHREKRQGSKPGVILMESGTDTVDPRLAGGGRHRAIQCGLPMVAVATGSRMTGVATTCSTFA